MPPPSRPFQVLPAAAARVTDLVDHLTAEHPWVPRLHAGQSMGEVGHAYDADVLGEDPAWRP